MDTSRTARKRHRKSGEEEARPHAGTPYSDSWSEYQADNQSDEKERMAQYFVEHDFLVQPGKNGITRDRRRDAHVFVTAGTTPNAVVHECLLWMKRNWRDGPCMITWYPLGGLIPASIIKFKSQHGQCATGTKLYLLPGEVDPQSGTLVGPETIQFLKNLPERVRFTLSILSAYRLDMATGDTFMYFGNEVEPQCVGAMMYAEEKVLFLDSTKFHSIGGSKGYNLRELLTTSRSVTLYTTTPNDLPLLLFQFEKLCARLLIPCHTPKHEDVERLRSLRLCIVNSAGEAELDTTREGILCGDEPADQPNLVGPRLMTSTPTGRPVANSVATSVAGSPLAATPLYFPPPAPGLQ